MQLGDQGIVRTMKGFYRCEMRKRILQILDDLMDREGADLSSNCMRVCNHMWKPRWKRWMNFSYITVMSTYHFSDVRLFRTFGLALLQSGSTCHS